MGSRDVLPAPRHTLCIQDPRIPQQAALSRLPEPEWGLLRGVEEAVGGTGWGVHTLSEALAV